MARDKTEIPRTATEKKGFFRAAGILIRSRLEPLSGWSWNTAAACFIAGRGFPPLIPSILVITAMILISLSVYIYNDVMEAEADKLNSVKKYRPLPSGEVSVKDALTLVYVSGCCGLFMLLLVNLYSLVFGLTYFVLLTAYSHPRIRLKGIFPLKESVLALCFPLTSLLGMYAVANAFVAHAFFAGIIIGIFVYLVEPVITDSTDIEEDTLSGVKTLASLLSWKTRAYLFFLAPLVIIMVVPLVYDALGFTVILPLAAVVGGFAFLWYTIPKMKRFDELFVRKVRNTSHIYFILLQVSFIIGSLN
ncbi:MAG: UbiA prenyltransferase family protein [Theionarchaea archaeon]|nr:UbiA prenyltransferase family protein [Theionarchaea archaeon]